MSSAPSGNPPDPSTLAPVVGSANVLRSVDPDDVVGWVEAEQRWEIATSAMTTEELTPSDRSGFGYSLFVVHLLSARCNARTSHEVDLLQRHAHLHKCTPTWVDGLVLRANVGMLTALGFGIGESADDCDCAEIKKAHASMWRGPTWSKAQVKAARRDALILLGKDAAFEDAERLKHRLVMARASLTPQVPQSGGGAGGTP